MRTLIQDVKRRRLPVIRSVTILAGSLGLLLFGTPAADAVPASTAPTVHASSYPYPDGNSGTNIDPLRANCFTDSPTCGYVGESYAYYAGENVNLLYSAAPYCDTSVATPGHAGCEVGTPAKVGPPNNTTSDQTLYIPIPLGFTVPTQCAAANGTLASTCIDHPQTVDLSALGNLGALGNFTHDTSVGIPAHDHIMATRAGDDPVWWNVVAVGVPSLSAWNALTSAKSYAELASLQAQKMVTPNIATNIFLFFQVEPGQVAAATAANQTSVAPPGPAPTYTTNSKNYSQPPNQPEIQTGSTIDNLKYDNAAGGPNTENIGVSQDWSNGQDVTALYTENYFCGTPTSGTSGAASGCEAGAGSSQLPPGVTKGNPAETNADSPSQSMDPLYIPVPLYAPGPQYLQCPATTACIDHPTSIDLSRLAAAVPALKGATNVALPGHDHLLRTRNQDQPEWWNVEVIGVETPQAMAQIEAAKSFAAVEGVSGTTATDYKPIAGVTAPIPTNVDLWFQTLPGVGPTTPPADLSSTCLTSLPSGSVVSGAALPDGSGYYEVDAAGDVAAFGAANCFGSLTGEALNKPIVGMAVDPATGGYWLTASDGGVFAFHAPFLGSEGGHPLNQPVVGIASTPSGNGYYLVASDGGIFTEGGAVFQGSQGAEALNKPVVGMAVDTSTGGYWLVASDGGIFTHNAPFFGSTGSEVLNKPVVGMAPTSADSGYRLFASDGGVFDFNATFFGSTGGMTLNKPVIGGLTNNAWDGYWLVASDGGIFSFQTPFYGSAA